MPAFGLSICQEGKLRLWPVFGFYLPQMVGRTDQPQGKMGYSYRPLESPLGGGPSPPPPLFSHVPSPSPVVTLCPVPCSCQAILHPDTNEKIFMPFRMSGKPSGPSGSSQFGPLLRVTAPRASGCYILLHTWPHLHLHGHFGSTAQDWPAYGAFEMCLSVFSA